MSRPRLLSSARQCSSKSAQHPCNNSTRPQPVTAQLHKTCQCSEMLQARQQHWPNKLSAAPSQARQKAVPSTKPIPSSRHNSSSNKNRTMLMMKSAACLDAVLPPAAVQLAWSQGMLAMIAWWTHMLAVTSGACGAVCSLVSCAASSAVRPAARL